ncbi:MAG: hypothetical protein LBC56_01560 [Oscillospiraceae bacterium]|jgi:hypothetical protein|nr:hypothetical protein [Oscillospiraceae bacterium]
MKKTILTILLACIVVIASGCNETEVTPGSSQGAFTYSEQSDSLDEASADNLPVFVSQDERSNPAQSSSADDIPADVSAIVSSQDEVSVQGEYLVLADHFVIDKNNTLFYYAIDENKKVNMIKALEGAKSVVPYSMRYRYNAIADILTVNNEAYDVDWMHADDLSGQTVVPLIKTIENLDSVKEVVGCNLFLKNDNTLWTFTDNVSQGDEGVFPIDAGTLDWLMIASDVEYAASSKNGAIIVAKTFGGEITVFQNRETRWQNATKIASGVDFCSVFFYPPNNGYYGVEIYYTDSELNLYHVSVEYSYDDNGNYKSQIAESQKIDEGVISYTAYWDTTYTTYVGGDSEWSYRVWDDSAENEVRLTEQGTLYGAKNYILSETRFTLKKKDYFIVYIVCLDQDGNMAVDADVTVVDSVYE